MTNNFYSAALLWINSISAVLSFRFIVFFPLPWRGGREGGVVVEDIRNVSVFLLPASPRVVRGELVKFRLIIGILAEDTFILLVSHHNSQAGNCAAVEPRLLIKNIIVLVYLNMDALSNLSFKARQKPFNDLHAE